MSDIQFQSIRVLPNSLDIKNNANQSLAEILKQWRLGLLLHGTVSTNAAKGEIIINTPFGKFSTTNTLKLHQGDQVSIKLLSVDSKITGNIVAVNHKGLVLEQSVEMHLVRQSPPPRPSAMRSTSSAPIHTIDTAKELSGTISYINLHKMDKSSFLYKMMNRIAMSDQSNIPISVKVKSGYMANLYGSFFLGEVSGRGSNNSQLIKTDFGIINLPDSQMPMGRKLILEITNLNNQPVNIDFSAKCADFIFKLNQSFFLFKSLSMTKLFQHLIPSNQVNSGTIADGSKVNRMMNNSVNDKKRLNDSDKTEQSELNSTKNKDLNNIIKAFRTNDEAKKIATEYREIKELLNLVVKNDDTSKIYSVLVPFYNGLSINDYKVTFDRSKESVMQFTINLEIDKNRIQLTGLVTFHKNTQNPSSFDMVIRSSQAFGTHIRQKILEIYRLNNEMSGLKGSVSIEQY